MDESVCVGTAGFLGDSYEYEALFSQSTLSIDLEFNPDF
jgi:hypothetical protein